MSATLSGNQTVATIESESKRWPDQLTNTDILLALLMSVKDRNNLMRCSVFAVCGGKWLIHNFIIHVPSYIISTIVYKDKTFHASEHITITCLQCCDCELNTFMYAGESSSFLGEETWRLCCSRACVPLQWPGWEVCCSRLFSLSFCQQRHACCQR